MKRTLEREGLRWCSPPVSVKEGAVFLDAAELRRWGGRGPAAGGGSAAAAGGGRKKKAGRSARPAAATKAGRGAK